MELHHQLLALIQQRGAGMVVDADQLRAALEDFLDEQAASTGDLNLLVDAVRLGGLNMLQSALQGGAAPAAAVEAAGDYLARQRGSADVASSRWACAALGYALGAVPDQVASGLRRSIQGGTAPSGFSTPGWQPPVQSPGLPPTQSPFQPPVQSPAQQWAQPGHSGQPAPYGSGGPAQPVPGQQFAPQQFAPQPTSKSKAPLIAVGAAVAVLLVGGGVAWAIASGGDDGDKKASDDTSVSDGPTDAQTTDGPTATDGPDTGASLEGMSPEEVRDEVIAAMGTVTSLNMAGTVATEDGVMSLDLSMDIDGNCTGALAMQGGEAQVMSVDSASYMRGDETFWIVSAGADNPAISMFVDKWVKLSADDNSFDDFCDLDNLLEDFTQGGDADFEVLGTRVVNGEEALELQADDGSQLLVRNRGDHHILKISSKGDEPGEFTLSKFNESLVINAPIDFVDLEAMG